MKSMLKRFVTVLITTSLVGVYLFGVFAFARPTFAREPASSLPSASIISATAACRVPTSPGANPCEGTNEAAQQIDDTLVKPAIQVALLTAVLNIAFYFIDRLTYEAAIWVATGGEGETPLFNAKSADKAWEDFGLDIAGEAVGQLADLSMAALNMDFNICAPTNPIFALSLAIGLEQAYKPREPLCKFQDVLSNWDSFISTTLETATNPSQTVLKAVADGFKPGQNELSASIGLNIKVHDQVLQTSTAKLFEQVNSGGFKAVTDVVTGQVATPGSTIQQNFNDEVTKSKENKTEFSMNAVINNKDLLSSMFMHVAGVFTNTLLSTLMNRLYTGLFDVQPDIDPFGDVENVATVTREDAEERFSSLIAATPSSIENYSVLSEFLACPTGYVAVRNVNNCVLDTNFAAALARVDAGSPMTVQAAIDEGLINGDWPLFPNEGEGVAKNQDPECYTYGYCYGNLVKMRKARILPVGWEMAASRNDTTNPSTLQEIVDGFADCGDQGGGIDNSHQWCHLIDPNWVLKLPETQCRALANGEVLISNLSGGRAGVCADTPSCLSEDSNGKCDGGYGYCVEETNAWQFRGEDCDEQYATCLSFQNTFTNDSANYLLNTVEYSTCDADNAGCEWYRTNKYYDDAGTTDDDSDDEYLWLPGDEVYTTASREDDIRSYLSSSTSRTDYTYNTEGGTVESYETYAYEDRMYFNNNVEECSEDAVGCTEVFAIDDSLVLNLVQNPSFENDEDEDALPDYWDLVGATYETAGDSYYGTDAIITDSATATTTVTQENIRLAASSFYTFSAYVKGTGAGATISTGTAILTVTDEDGDLVDLAGTSSAGDCALSLADTASAYSATNPYNTYTTSFTDADTTAEWQQFTCTFTTADEPLVATIVLTEGSTDAVIDSIQLELGDDASSFTEGYNSSSPSPSYLLLPPDYLNCTGDETDPAECDNYTQMCSAVDVGCNLYTPEDGDPSVPAIASSVDECPSECVGYTTYKQEATDREDDDFPLYFIADASSSCSSQYVGCDAFTNLDAVEDGGEGTESYTYLRACMKTSMDEGSTYFTWEGSDAAGYQLMTWTLLPSDETDAPCTTPDVQDEDTLICNDPGTYTESEDCDAHEDIFENPDCREFYTTGGDLFYRDITETVAISDDCHPYRFTGTSETDCEDSGGFWTAAGDCRYFGLPDESTECPLAQAGCREYTGGAGRNATTVYSDDFEGGDTAEYKAGTSTITVEISNESIATDGHSLHVSFPSTGGQVATNVQYLNWDSTSAEYDETDATTCTGTAHTVTDSGCEIDWSDGHPCTVEDGDNNCGTLDDLIVNGKTYTLSFWAKGSDPIYVVFEHWGSGTTKDFVDPNDGESDNDALTLEGGWHEYTLGPLDTTGTSFDDASVITFNGVENAEFYIDNIQLKAVEEDITIIKDSWVVPSTCDQTPDGADSDQYYLGCEAYTDHDGEDIDLYQFSDLCSEEVVGCEAVYDTQNSDSEYGQVFNARCQYDYGTDLTTLEPVGSSTTCSIDDEDYCTIAAGESYCTFDVDGLLPTPLPSGASSTTDYEFYVILGPETVVVPNDTPRYVVDNGDTDCTSENVACEEIGLPTYNQDKTEVESFESVYYINDPDDYADILCDDEALFCEEWSSTEDGNFYFKDPVDQTCEYQSGVTIDGTSYSGWFRSETNEPCYWDDDDSDGEFSPSTDSSYTIAGSQFGIWRNGDDDFTGWGGTCSSSADRCKAFLDLSDTSEGDYPGGSPYYYLDDESLSEEALTASEQCQGQASQKEGCALFSDTNDAELTYATGPSYIAATRADLLFGDAPGSLVDAIDCNDGGESFDTPDGDSVNLCNLRCRYEVGADVYLEIGNQIASSVSTDTAEFSGSCYVDDDCPMLPAGDGNDYEGTCVDVSTDAFGDGAVTTTDIDTDAVYENDANRVIKVYRDRECSAWMACSTSRVVWDTRTSKYVTVCEQTARCTKYGSDGTTCIQSDTTDPEPLSVSRYASRDITWSGVEYSGYSIPDQLGIDHFSEININPDTNSTICMNLTEEPEIGSDGGFVACDSTDDCAEEYNDYCQTSGEEIIRLAAVVGDCDMYSAGWGGECNVGFCEESGDSCNDDTDCDTSTVESCIVGYCQALSTTGCASDADADGNGLDDACESVSGYPYCDTVQGYCVDELTPNENGCADDTGCSAGSCVQSARAYTGNCVNSMCIVDLNGNPIDPDNADESMCRGYPESFSPFPTKVVTQWLSEPGGDTATLLVDTTDDSAGGTKVDTVGESDAIPYSFAYGYQGAAVCSPDSLGNTNNDCICSYDKVTYGGGSTTRYFEDGNGVSAESALCVGGSYNGMACTPSADPTVNDCGSGGVCNTISRVDTYYGWHGYCLERDSSIQLYGSTDTDDQPCLTWLPVDQTSSSSDLYGKSTEAGFAMENTYYCAEVGVYVDLYPTGSMFSSGGVLLNSGDADIDLACAAATQGLNAGNGGESGDWHGFYDGTDVDVGAYDCVFGEYDQCYNNVSCPTGYIGIVGYCNHHTGRDNDDVVLTSNGVRADDSSSADALFGDNICTEGKTGVDRSDGTDADYCPYFCIPNNSYHTSNDDGNAGELCINMDDDGIEGDLVDNLDRSYTTSGLDYWNYDGDSNGDDGDGDTDTLTFNEDYESDDETTVFFAGNLFDNNITTTDGSIVDDIDFYKDCAVLGVPYVNGDIELDDETYDLNWLDDTGDSTTSGVFNGSGYRSNVNGGSGSSGLAVNPIGASWGVCRTTSYDSSGGSTIRYSGVCSDENADTTCSGYSIQTDGSGYSQSCVSVTKTDSGALRPYLGCYEIVQASVESAVNNFYNQAWTNRLSSYTGFETSTTTEESLFSGYSNSSTISPAGQVPLSDFYDAPSVLETGNWTGNTNLLSYLSNTTIDALTYLDAYPVPIYSCDESVSGYGDGEIGITVDDYSASCTQYDYPFSDTSVLGRTYEDAGSTSFESQALISDYSEVMDEIGGSSDDTYSSLESMLSRFFNKVYYSFQYVWDEDGGYYQGDTYGGNFVGTDTPDEFGDAADNAKTDISNEPGSDSANTALYGGERYAPIVVSLGECDGATCDEGKIDYITINGIDSGNLSGEEGLYHASMSFYTYANANHMPIRKIIVDWSDEDLPVDLEWGTHFSGSTSNENYYKNFRGMNIDSGESYCDDSAWGKTSESCSTRYQTYSNDFVCTQDMVTRLQNSGRTCADVDANGVIDTSPCVEDSSCVYQPRVHVIDNWGWCTGYCDSDNTGSDGTDECYQGSTTDTDECDFEECPGGGCDAAAAGTYTVDPWIYFDGYVIVSPD